MINPLSLIAGIDIPFPQAQLTIHQPRIDEISYIGQTAFFTGCEYLTLSKNNIITQDKNNSQTLDDFEILMTIIKDKNPTVQTNKVYIELVLLLLFPQYRIDFLPMSIRISKKNQKNKLQSHLIDKNNFSQFKKIISEMFCLSSFLNKQNIYNPGGPQAKALVQKFKKRHQKLAELKNRGKDLNKQISIISQYVSILAVGEHKDINTLCKYTIYQLLDQFQRFKMKQNFDVYIQAKLAGAKNLDEVDNWMGEIHSN